MNKSLIAALMGGIVGLANPAFAQDSVVTTDRVVVTREVVVSPRVVPAAYVPYATRNPGREFANLGGGVGGAGGGVGGAIGGYYINGTTPADNRPLPGGIWPYR